MELQRGLVRSYDPTTHTAAVLLAGSLSRTLLTIPVSQQIPPDQMLEGADCAVAFFEDQANALVLATFGAPPEPRVVIYQDTNTSDLTLSTDWQTMAGLSIDVAPPEPHSWDVVAMTQVMLRSTNVAELVDTWAQMACDGSRVGTYAQVTIYDNWVGSSVPLFHYQTVSYSDPKTYTVQARKSGGSYSKAAILAQMVIMAFPT
jgi:hypothetical protein